ncbi:MAG: tRNA-uridine aminocarboxypropyltransferase, partial [Bacteriovoracaceae bacterium]
MKIIEPRPTCYKCYRPKKACFCESIEPLKTTFEFRILIHPKEARVGHVGTGRVANQALLNSKIIIDATFDNNKEVQEILNSDEFFPMVLYPGENSHNISHDSFPESYFEGKTPLIFIIDGTWPCAKSMMRDSKCLHGLPRISFDSSVESKYSIRHQPAKYC